MGCWGPLAKRTADTPEPSTRGFHWTGDLFQGRFRAVATDEPHLLAAARYVAGGEAVGVDVFPGAGQMNTPHVTDEELRRMDRPDTT